MKRCTFIVLVLALVSGMAGSLWSQETPKDLSPFVALGYELVLNLYPQPVVQNGQLKDKGPLGKQRYLGKQTVGSGTIISKDGLILTNYHVYAVSEYQYDSEKNVLLELVPASRDMVVYVLGKDPLMPPEPKYLARPIAVNKDKDMCLLQIIAHLDTGQPIQSPNFKYVDLGNPYDIPLNSELTILGYPGKGGSTVTITTGQFLGYTKDSRYAEDGSIKTDATIAGGNSGGSTLYKKRLVAVPTRVSNPVEKGFDFGYLHPVTWAVRPFAVARLKYGIRVPELDSRWLSSDYNPDPVKSHAFIGGRIYAVQSYAAVPEAVVLIYRGDRTLEQIVQLIQEEKTIMAVLKIQALAKRGAPPEALAAAFGLTLEQVQQILALQVTEGSLSPDLRRKLQGEFFYRIDQTDEDGFFLADVPRNQDLNLFVQRKGFRNLTRTIHSGNDLYQELGRISIVEY